MRILALLTAGLLLVACWTPVRARQPKGVKMPDAVKVPDGYNLVVKYNAEGVQVYKAVAGRGGRLEWSFEEPIAELADEEGGKAGIHYYGPAWEAADGSKVVKDGDKQMHVADAPRPDRDVPWLLIAVKADDPRDAKPGVLRHVVYVQRIATLGGRAPKEPPIRAGGKIAVPYKAVYYFWTKGDAR